ncbi:acetyl-CoA hydrolase/transferase family protein [Clostridium tetani]|uniref:acetyl-CoA hydrolase/transferase family protein n=1 Tax=Clostridium tetani TaxID=1513 RepID=UPI00100B7A48|nr:acetyl-CoA hydrolase/transferase C-terminal domain-containing protein [Clostridium tetani]RXI62648.1 4-hydroxybutyrate CoA-transferase [Clostridium tetani]
MNWEDIYKSKILSSKEAVLKLKSENHVAVGHAASEPRLLMKALVDNKESFRDLKLYQMIALEKSECAKKGMEKHFSYNSLFVGGGSREAINDGRADYIPCFFSRIPRLFRENYIKLDAALIQVAPPDEHGFCSFGVSSDYIKPAAECAKLVIAEVNDKMPRTLGDNFIHVSDIDYIVENSREIPELKPSNIGDIERAIGENCASLINNGDVLQLGIGAIPDAVLLFLKDKKDLGIHSEMISDGVVDLVKAGVINNKKKTLHQGKIIVSFLMGTKKLYDFVDNNPMVRMYPVDYVNNPVVISKNDNMVSINSCIQIDLMGQIDAETIGFTQISGVGGQIDFIRGAGLSKNGRSIIAIPSTVGNGKISKIVPLLDKGAAVTTTRNEVDYVVTEYGIARLKGKNLRDRARELIKIAHPDFREELKLEYKNRFKEEFKRIG